jgi:hypothetical protein
MLKPINKQDITIRKFQVYKEFSKELSLDEYNTYPLFAKSGSFGNYNEEIVEKTHGIAKIPLYASIKAQFYNNPATASVLTEVGRRRSYASTNERILEDEIAILAIPQIKYGEGIKVGSVILVDGGITYTDDGFSNLLDSGSNIKGNIFYDRGLVILTKDINSGSTLSNFNLSFRSIKTIYENEIFLSVYESEFNTSTNPTAVDSTGKILGYGIQSSIEPGIFGGFDEYDYSSSIDPTGSYLAPYVTTIGLYDDDNNMVAMAKLPQPVKSLPDYPLNFIVRFDT